MPIWVMGGANTVLSIEGVVLEGVDVNDMRPSHKLENGRVPVHMVWIELNKLMSGVRVAVQQ